MGALRATDDHREPLRRVQRSAFALVVGVVLSGPAGLLLVAWVHPQPAWQGPARFAAELDRVQILPYVAGLLLIAACVALVCNLVVLAPEERKARAYGALVATATFSAIILFNYILQATFVPSLARAYQPENDALISALTMANPGSLAWALEMWGYGALGVATWAIAFVFDTTGLEGALWNLLMIAMGVTTILAMRARSASTL